MTDVRVNEDLLTIREVAVMLSVSPHSIRRYVAVEGMPHIRINPRMLRFRRSDVERWVATREVNPVEA